MSKKHNQIQVLDNTITVTKDDYISLTDMLKAKDGDFFISDWLRNRNTLEYLGIWEKIHNPDFNYGEFAIIKNQSGLNSYKISVKEWVEKTKAIGLTATVGRYGGTAKNESEKFNRSDVGARHAVPLPCLPFPYNFFIVGRCILPDCNFILA